jgi:hypothetical protein
MKRAEADFDAEPVDVEWSTLKRNEIIGSLAAFESEVHSAQIECRSLTCRVELTSTNLESPDEQRQRTSLWARQVLEESGFVREDTRFYSDRFTTLSYFTMKPWNNGLELPPEIPEEVAESFRQAMRETAQRQQGPASGTGGIAGSRGIEVSSRAQ